MSHDWKRLGKALQAARNTKGLTQPELARLGGISKSTVQSIERGKSYAKPRPAHGVIARLVGWTDDSVRTVLAGGDPTFTEPPSPAPRPEPAEGGVPVPMRLVEPPGGSGPLVGTTRIPIPGGGSVTVTVEGVPDQSAKQRRKNLEAWRRIQDVLMEIDIDASPDDPSTNADEA
ncbi:helix-turn-helix transcriptional regulator [Streptomyces sp. CAI-121]|uniref:helix-turn-helix domain-containing protein n=1 Tax=unclassified Streptomyces TaxID=2593676 RepID=UPI001587ED4F|nr:MULTISPECIES: helix-turn-helix transcriptional regulator [unclassified Streptomyces]NUV65732.1 helix-turn-helix transcriptional regulator [Streptomyces sp. CAI-121]NUW12469.1 helix-turn-helix transcriptional regulator [Streptomyces sp. CAI-68]